MPHKQAILQALGLPVYVPRVPIICSFALWVSEPEAAFGPEHQTQLSKMMTYLGKTPEQYRIFYADVPTDFSPSGLLQLGQGPCPLKATMHIVTHSISEMLTTPACKKQVMHDIAPLKA